MQVTSYGLFWREDEIEWNPGQGNRNEFRILGRIGAQRKTLRVVDFRYQQGIYILHDDYGPAYVGLVRGGGGGRLGARLKEHRDDRLSGKWDRFSWFGFNPIDAQAAHDGVFGVSPSEEDLTDDTSTTIKDLEALLIAAMGPKLNIQKMKFGKAERWEQIGYWEWQEIYRERATPQD